MRTNTERKPTVPKRRDRRPSPPSDPPEAEQADEGERLRDDTSLRVEDARRLLDELRRIRDRYDLSDNFGAQTDGMTAASALVADPGQTLHGAILTLELALEQADGRPGVVSHE
jgi:hypothetical protein